jgi:predicted unusual protein kinase regulating ubiquinone biosynthesis (AarF/ABC1/UbiB family)
MPWSKVRGVLDREWDEPVEELFEDFEHDAAAAASIGQVHRAVLPDGPRPPFGALLDRQLWAFRGSHDGGAV